MYLVIPDTILNDATLTANEKLALAYVNSLKASKRKCYISVRGLAKLLAVSEKTAFNTIRSLIEKKRIYEKFSAKNGKFSEREILLPHEIVSSDGIDRETLKVLREFQRKYRFHQKH